MKIENYNQLIELIKTNHELIIDLNNLNNHDYIRTIYFISGLTYLNGKMTKIQSKVFKIKY